MHVTLRSASIYPQTGRYKTIMISNAKEHTRETVSQPIIREKLQWDAQDAKSSLGNATFSRGDYKRSFLIHSACMQLSGTRCIIETIRRSSSDATLALEQRSMMAKGYFRRGQARELIGILGEGAEDFLTVFNHRKRASRQNWSR